MAANTCVTPKMSLVNIGFVLLTFIMNFLTCVKVIAETTVRDPEERGARRQREILEEKKLCATA